MKRIVLIEHDRQFGESVRLYLSRLGYSVEHVDRPCAASNTVRTFRPDVVLTDMLAAGDRNSGLCTILKRDCSGLCNFKLLLFSSDEAHTKQMLDDGLVDGFLRRDIPLEQLGDAIDSFCRPNA